MQLEIFDENLVGIYFIKLRGKQEEICHISFLLIVDFFFEGRLKESVQYANTALNATN